MLEAKSSSPLSLSSELIARLERLPVSPFRSIGSLVGSGLLFAGIDVVAIAILAPTLISVFQLKYADVGVLIGAVYMGQILGAILLGSLAARFGRKFLLLTSLGLFSLLSLIAAFAPSFGALFLLRIAIGIPLGCFVPIATAYFSEYIPAAKRGLSTSGVLFLYTAGFLLAPFVLAFVLQPLFGGLAWRVLLGIGILPLLLIPLAVKFLPESVRWLISQQRLSEAEACVARLEEQALHKNNGQPLPEPRVVPLQATVIEKKARIGNLFSAGYWCRTLLVWLRWFVGASVLVGFSSWLPTLYALMGLQAFQV